MIVSKKSVVEFSFIDSCVRAFFSSIRGSSFSGIEVSELFRYSMCRLLGLKSMYATKRVEEMSKIVVNSIKPLCVRYDFDNYSEVEKQGILEACVHCMEMSRKRAGL